MLELDIRREAIAVTTTISLLRGISFFRLFQETRYIIQLLVCVIRDMKSFCILLAYSTVSFSLVFMVVRGDADFMTYFQISYLTNIGQFDANIGNYDFLSWVIFIFCSISNLIILLNMLIAIMGETFNNVRENSELADYIEIAEMVLEVETAFYGNRKLGNKTYLQLCEAEVTLDSKDLLMHDIKIIKRLLKKIDRAITQNPQTSINTS